MCDDEAVVHGAPGFGKGDEVVVALVALEFEFGAEALPLLGDAE